MDRITMPVQGRDTELCGESGGEQPGESLLG